MVDKSPNLRSVIFLTILLAFTSWIINYILMFIFGATSYVYYLIISLIFALISIFIIAKFRIFEWEKYLKENKKNELPKQRRIFYFVVVFFYSVFHVIFVIYDNYDPSINDDSFFYWVVIIFSVTTEEFYTKCVLYRFFVTQLSIKKWFSWIVISVIFALLHSSIYSSFFFYLIQYSIFEIVSLIFYELYPSSFVLIIWHYLYDLSLLL